MAQSLAHYDTYEYVGTPRVHEEVAQLTTHCGAALLISRVPAVKAPEHLEKVRYAQCKWVICSAG